MTKAHSFNAGDILISKWGYDQTNADFFKVTKVTAKCAYIVTLQTIDQYASDSDGQSTGITAIPGDVVDATPVRRKVINLTGDDMVSMDYSFARLWNGAATSVTKTC
tara:strand:+ start:570 stop:890 length:321 start_codon:yes stop_codon:yes gene_type:complete